MIFKMRVVDSINFRFIRRHAERRHRQERKVVDFKIFRGGLFALKLVDLGG